MFNKKKVLVTGAVMALGMAVSGVASAQTDILRPSGPVEINGYVSINNTGRPGGLFTDFACKVKGYGRIANNSRQIVIEGIQAQSRSSGQIPRGCVGVTAANLPWTVTIGANPAGAPVAVTNNVTVTGVVFQAPPQPGCGTSSGAVGGTLGAGTVLWSQDGVDPTMVAADASYSTLTFTNTVITETPNTNQNCVLNGLIKITRPLAPTMMP